MYIQPNTYVATLTARIHSDNKTNVDVHKRRFFHSGKYKRASERSFREPGELYSLSLTWIPGDSTHTHSTSVPSRSLLRNCRIIHSAAAAIAKRERRCVETKSVYLPTRRKPGKFFPSSRLVFANLGRLLGKRGCRNYLLLRLAAIF